MRRCKLFYICGTTKNQPNLSLCYLLDCNGYSPIKINEDVELFVNKLNEGLPDWKSLSV